MNLISYIYTYFQTYISTYIPSVKSVDLFFDQFESQAVGESDGRSNPRVLIEILEFEPQGNIGQAQSWIGEVKLHIGIDVINTFYDTSETKDTNLIYLDLLDTIYKQLSLITVSNATIPGTTDFKLYNIERSYVLFATNQASIKVTEVNFKFQVDDYSNLQPIQTETVAGIGFTVTT